MILVHKQPRRNTTPDDTPTNGWVSTDEVPCAIMLAEAPPMLPHEHPDGEFAP